MTNTRRIIVVGLLVLWPALAACQSANDARAQFCEALRNLAPSAAQLIEGKGVVNAGQLKQSMALFRDALSMVVSQASQVPSVNLDKLIQALDGFESQVKALPNDMPIQQAMTRVSEAAGRFKVEFDAIAGAVCAKN